MDRGRRSLDWGCQAGAVGMLLFYQWARPGTRLPRSRGQVAPRGHDARAALRVRRLRRPLRPPDQRRARGIEFYRTLALEAGGLVVELGVGTGRIAIPSALAGARVLGIDFSSEMLTFGRRNAAEAGATSLQLVRGDMRRFALRQPAALVTVPFRTFLHNLTIEDQLATLASVHAALRPGGHLALNIFNPDITKIVDAIRAGSAWKTDPLGFDQRLEYEADGARYRGPRSSSVSARAARRASRLRCGTSTATRWSTCWLAQASRWRRSTATTSARRSRRHPRRWCGWRGARGEGSGGCRRPALHGRLGVPCARRWWRPASAGIRHRFVRRC
ncbi:MAG: methyltransferase domain-containing protein [Dehalococcoidia bacterium]|nr:methyltransferase domain-containing protein [Dehalococcoidia bacterium]